MMSSEENLSKVSSRTNRSRSQSLRLEQRPSFKDNVKITLDRAKARVSHKFGRLDRTRDEFLNQFESNFNKQQEQMSKLQKAIKVFAVNVRAMAVASQQVQDSFLECYESTWTNRKECGDALQKMTEFWLSYVSTLTNRVKNPLADYSLMAVEVKHKLTKRQKRLLDYDIARKLLEDARMSKKPLEETKLKKVENEFLETKNIYDELTLELYDDLPVFNDRRIEAIAETWEIFFNASVALHSEMTKQCQIVTDSVINLRKCAQQGDYKLSRPDDETLDTLKRSNLINPLTVSMTDSLHRADHWSGKGKSPPVQLDDSVDFEDVELLDDPRYAQLPVAQSAGIRGRSNSLLHYSMPEPHTKPKVVDNRHRIVPPKSGEPPIDLLPSPPSRMPMSANTTAGSGSGGVRPLKVLPTSISVDKMKEVSREFPITTPSGPNSQPQILSTKSPTTGGPNASNAFIVSSGDTISSEANRKSNPAVAMPVTYMSPKPTPPSKGGSPDELIKKSAGTETSSHSPKPSGSGIVRAERHSVKPIYAEIKPSVTAAVVKGDNPSNGKKKPLTHTKTNWSSADDPSSQSSGLASESSSGTSGSYDKAGHRAVPPPQLPLPISDPGDNLTDVYNTILKVINSPNSPPLPTPSSQLPSLGQTQQEAKIVSVKFAYQPQDDDELSLAVGDLVQIVPWDDENLREDGWEFGVHLSSKRRGLFPLNHTSPHSEHPSSTSP